MSSRQPHQYDLLELDPLPGSTAAPSEAPTPPTTPTSPTPPLGVRVRTVVKPAPLIDNATELSERRHGLPTIRELATEEHAIAKDHGFNVKSVDSGLAFAAGTELWDVGQANLQRYQEEYNALPTVSVAAAAHKATIATEARKDSIIEPSKFRIDPNGDLRLWTAGGWGTKGIAVSDHAYQQLATTSGTQNVNRVLPVLSKPLRLRARTLPAVGSRPERREAFAILNAGKRGYTPKDTDEVLALAAKLAPDLKAEVDYDQETTTLRARLISANAPVDIPAFNGVGRVHRIGIDLWSADNGTMAIRVEPFLIRIRCKNATLVRHGGTKRRFRHVGSYDKLQEGLTESLQSVASAVSDLTNLWQRAAATYYMDPDGGKLSAEEAIRRLVLNDHLPLNGMSRDDAVSAYVSAWREEPGESVASVIMAVQRAAHETTWRTKWGDHEAEEAAADLLYQRVYVALPDTEPAASTGADW